MHRYLIAMSGGKEGDFQSRVSSDASAARVHNRHGFQIHMRTVTVTPIGFPGYMAMVTPGQMHMRRWFTNVRESLIGRATHLDRPRRDPTLGFPSENY